MTSRTTLHILGSGSKGNAFAVVYDGAVLLLDAGFSTRELDRRLAAAGIEPGALAGVAITHEHGDHAASAVRLACRHDVPLLASVGTWTAIGTRGDECEFRPLSSQSTVTVGPFTLTGCPTSHDAAEPLALGVTVPGGFSLAMAYDLGRPTQAVRWFLRERHCLVLEANHDEVLLRTSGYPAAVQQRIAGPGGHLSNHDAARLLQDVHHEELHTVVLAHLSQRCNRPMAARDIVAPALAACGFVGELVCAEQDGPMPPIAMQPPAQRSLFG